MQPFRTLQEIRNTLNKMNKDKFKDILWKKLRIIPGYAPNEYRADYYGKMVRYSHYGDRNSPFGWEIDHIIPESLGGSNNLSNLRAINWFSNASHGGYLGQINKRQRELTTLPNLL